MLPLFSKVNPMRWLGTSPGEILRFLGGGLSTSALYFGLMFVFVDLVRIKPILAVNLIAPCLYLYGYLVNKLLVFRNYEVKHLRQGSKFLITQVALAGLVNVLMYVGVNLIGLHYMIVTVVSAGLVAALNFTIMKLAVFV